MDKLQQERILKLETSVAELSDICGANEKERNQDKKIIENLTLKCDKLQDLVSQLQVKTIVQKSSPIEKKVHNRSSQTDEYCREVAQVIVPEKFDLIDHGVQTDNEFISKIKKSELAIVIPTLQSTEEHETINNQESSPEPMRLPSPSIENPIPSPALTDTGRRRFFRNASIESGNDGKKVTIQLRRSERFEKQKKMNEKIQQKTNIIKPTSKKNQNGNHGLGNEEQNNSNTTSRRRRRRNVSFSGERKKRNKKVHKCCHCNEEFDTRDQRIRHEVVHTGIHPFTCSYCDKGFYSKKNLRSHENTHTRSKKFECDVCRRVFYRKCKLGIHMRKHTGDKPYNCRYCSKCFIRKDYLDMHERIHTGAKPFLCHLCPKQYNQKHSLNEHLKIHQKIVGGNLIESVVVCPDLQLTLANISSDVNTSVPLSSQPNHNPDIQLSILSTNNEPSFSQTSGSKLITYSYYDYNQANSYF